MARRPARGVARAAIAVGLLLAIVAPRAFAQSPEARPAADETRAAASSSAPAHPAPTSAEMHSLLREPAGLSRAVVSSERALSAKAGEPGDRAAGFYPEFSNLPTGSGWVSIGPGYRRRFAGDQLLLDMSAAISWRSYKMAQARLELPRLARDRVTAGIQLRWQDLTQVTFFGVGAGTSASTRSEYRLRSTNAVGYATVRPTRWLALSSRFGWLGSPSVLPPAGTFQRGNPGAQDVFPNDPVYATSDQPAFVHGGASITVDRRNHRGHPTQGGLYRAAWAGFSDRRAGTFSFRRSELEATQFVPVAGRRVVLAVHGWLVASQTAANQVVPFHLMPSLGGHNTIRAYADFRFHDRNLLLLTGEARVALYTHVDAAVFVDAGNVAARVGDVNLARRGYGLGLRVHTVESTLGRLDVAHGDEGWRFVFRLSDPLQLSRLTRRMAALPFVP